MRACIGSVGAVGVWLADTQIRWSLIKTVPSSMSDRPEIHRCQPQYRYSTPLLHHIHQSRFFAFSYVDLKLDLAWISPFLSIQPNLRCSSDKCPSATTYVYPTNLWIKRGLLLAEVSLEYDRIVHVSVLRQWNVWSFTHLGSLRYHMQKRLRVWEPPLCPDFVKQVRLVQLLFRFNETKHGASVRCENERLSSRGSVFASVDKQM